MHLRPSCLMFATVLVAGVACAPTIGPVSLPVDVLVVLDSQARSLLLVNVDSTADTLTLKLPSGLPAAPSTLAIHGTTVAVGLGASDSVLIIDVVSGQSAFISLGVGFGTITALAYDNGGNGYAAARAGNIVWKFDPSGNVGNAPVTGGPQGFGIARGSVFVVAGNREHCDQTPIQFCGSTDPSFVFPFPSSLLIDSIPLGPPGNAGAAVAAPDGLLYVLSSGNGVGLGQTEGVLSKIDPVTRTFKASYTGFGALPLYLASDGGDRLYVASQSTLSVFSISAQSVVRGPGAAIQGIPLQGAVALLTDEVGRAYVVQSSSASICVADQPGKIRVFGTDLIEQQAISTGPCPVAAAFTEIQANLFPHH